jgi:ribose 5-phosphate isomerase B
LRYAVACDHAGLGLKAPLVAELEARGHQVTDLGTYTPESCHYPEYAAKVALEVADGRADAGLLLCGTGLGMAITANKFAGIRAVSVSEPFSAEMARRHNDANILCLGARVLSQEGALQVLRAWLEAEFEGGRHQLRVELMMAAAEGNRREDLLEGGRSVPDLP